MKGNYKLLIVDDELANLQKLKRTFVEEFQVYEARDARQALILVNENTFAAVVTDQKMPGMTGVELLRELLKVSPETARIILTGYTDVEDLIEAINQGHVDRYITKPWEPDALKQVVRQEVERWELQRENVRLSRELERANDRLSTENRKLKKEMECFRESGKKLVYRSRAMGELLKLVDRVVATDSTVLIQGETGTGKELLARYIHDRSTRADQPFIPVNCGAIPADLMESTFFGHKKGAFTGATEDKKGYFELADGGSLFLDEIGESSMALQVKLLRVLQEDEIFPVGGQKAKRIDIRLIASTNRILSREVEEGRFRQDLFFRLNVFAVFVPPLRARQDDIGALGHFFLQQFRSKLGKEVPGFEESALNMLRDYDWPGNVRELENEIERLIILCNPSQAISSDMVSERIRLGAGLADSEGALLKEKLAHLEKRLILDALRDHQHNKSRAAAALGISRQTIIAKLKQYDR